MQKESEGNFSEEWGKEICQDQKKSWIFKSPKYPSEQEKMLKQNVWNCLRIKQKIVSIFHVLELLVNVWELQITKT